MGEAAADPGNVKKTPLKSGCKATGIALTWDGSLPIMKPPIRSYAFDSLDVRSKPGVTVPRSQSFSSERTNPRDSASKLERVYPAMANAIRLLWGFPEMNEYFDKLWLADGRAEPIDPEVMADLMLLARLHQDIVPMRPRASQSSIYGTAYGERPARQDVWGTAPRVR